MAVWMVLFLCLSALYGSSVSIRDSSFRFRVPSGWYECFYEDYNSKNDARMELFFEVVQGGSLDIEISVYSPDERPVIFPAIKKRGMFHSITTDENGPYKICLDNTFSHISDKVVFLNIIVHEISDNPTHHSEIESPLNNSALALLESFSVIRQRLTNITIQQHYVRSREARHRLTAFSNKQRVFVWSLIETVAMVTVFILQVVLIRSMFMTGKRRDGLRT